MAIQTPGHPMGLPPAIHLEGNAAQDFFINILNHCFQENKKVMTC